MKKLKKTVLLIMGMTFSLVYSDENNATQSFDEKNYAQFQSSGFGQDEDESLGDMWQGAGDLTEWGIPVNSKNAKTEAVVDQSVGKLLKTIKDANVEVKKIETQSPVLAEDSGLNTIDQAVKVIDNASKIISGNASTQDYLELILGIFKVVQPAIGKIQKWNQDRIDRKNGKFVS
jgi:hypothetical protein